ncbi:unnamed protein product, partial [Closterium sp. NIES-54]
IHRCGGVLPNALPSALSNALLSALPIALISKALLLHTSDSRRGDVNGFAAIAHVFSWRPRRRRGGRRKAARSSATSRRPPSLPGAIRVVPCNVPLPRNGESLGVAEQGAPPPGGSHGSRAPLGAHARAATCPQQPHRRQQLATWHALLPACTFFDTSVLMGRRRQEQKQMQRVCSPRSKHPAQQGTYSTERGTEEAGGGTSVEQGWLLLLLLLLLLQLRWLLLLLLQVPSVGGRPTSPLESSDCYKRHREAAFEGKSMMQCYFREVVHVVPGTFSQRLGVWGGGACLMLVIVTRWVLSYWIGLSLSSITVITGRVSTALLGKPKSNLRAPVLAGERSGVARAERRQHPNRSLQSTSRFYPKMSPCMAVWQFLGCLITGSIITHQERVESIGSKASTLPATTLPQDSFPR